MERALSPDEKLRRAEQIYYQRRETKRVNNRKTVNVPVSNSKYKIKKMIIQIIICFCIYGVFFVIKNYNFIFSKEVIDKTNEVLSYDINIQEIYYKVANYINNNDYFNKEKENQISEPEGKLKEEDKIIENSDIEIIEELEIAEKSTSEVDSEEKLTQMDIDVKEIKEKYGLIRPVEGQITSRFGNREVTSPVISPYHIGLDIGANTGTIIVASMDGEVVHAGELGGYGLCVQTQKDDILVIYGHCSKLYVNKGDIVTKGQQLAEVGETGNATGPHLHFEIRKSERYVDPQMILDI